MAGIHTTLRLPESLLDRADALIPKLEHLAGLTSSGELVRSDVLRLALARGLKALEAEHGAVRPKRR